MSDINRLVYLFLEEDESINQPIRNIYHEPINTKLDYNQQATKNANEYIQRKQEQDFLYKKPDIKPGPPALTPEQQTTQDKYKRQADSDASAAKKLYDEEQKQKYINSKQAGEIMGAKPLSPSASQIIDHIYKVGDPKADENFRKALAPIAIPKKK